MQGAGTRQGLQSYHDLPPHATCPRRYDDSVIRPAGTAVPFLALAARISVNLAADWLSGDRPRAANGSGRGGRGRLSLPTLGLSCLLLYSAMAAVRGLLYTIHWHAMKVRGCVRWLCA